jgi:hypothetical protein
MSASVLEPILGLAPDVVFGLEALPTAAIRRILYPSSLFEHALGSWLERVNHPSDSLSFNFVF